MSAEVVTRRGWLLTAVTAGGVPVRTSDAERLLAGTSWSCHRNTARKDLRGLSRRGLLVLGTDAKGRRTYAPVTTEHMGDQ